MSHVLHVAPSPQSPDLQEADGNARRATEFPETCRPTNVPADTAQINDEELVIRAQAGDQRAFGDLIQRHFATCLRRAVAMLRNRCDAEDEVQNACSKAFQNLNSFRFEGPFSAWLCRIVQNQCLMLIRENRHARFSYVDAITHSNAKIELVNQTPDPEDELGAQQVDNLLHREILRVPPLMRNVMMLRDVERLPMPEVAARLGLSVPAAKSRLMRARREMRARLARHCGASGPRALTNKVTPRKAEYTYVG